MNIPKFVVGDILHFATPIDITVTKYDPNTELYTLSWKFKWSDHYSEKVFSRTYEKKYVEIVGKLVKPFYHQFSDLKMGDIFTYEYHRQNEGILKGGLFLMIDPSKQSNGQCLECKDGEYFETFFKNDSNLKIRILYRPEIKKQSASASPRFKKGDEIVSDKFPVTAKILRVTKNKYLIRSTVDGIVRPDKYWSHAVIDSEHTKFNIMTTETPDLPHITEAPIQSTKSPLFKKGDVLIYRNNPDWTCHIINVCPDVNRYVIKEINSTNGMTNTLDHNFQLVESLYKSQSPGPQTPNEQKPMPKNTELVHYVKRRNRVIGTIVAGLNSNGEINIGWSKWNKKSRDVYNKTKGLTIARNRINNPARNYQFPATMRRAFIRMSDRASYFFEEKMFCTELNNILDSFPTV